MKSIAIIIGISAYQDSRFEVLPSAQADAGRFAGALSSWGLPQEWIHVILQNKATKADIIKTFYDCRPNFDSDAKLIVYFAGHGIREIDTEKGGLESALILYDTTLDSPLSTGLKLNELMQLIGILKPLQTFLFVDACNLRLNQIENPLNDVDVLASSNFKGLFCLLSTGIKSSFEDAELKYGYFTTALLRALGELRSDANANCHDLLKKVQQSLKKQLLPPAEHYHIGSEKLWPLEQDYEEQTLLVKGNTSLVWRQAALAKLQDFLVTFPDPVIWMWGEGGLGKTVIAEQFCHKHPLASYLSIPHMTNFPSIIASLIDQLRNKKSALFFKHPTESSLFQILDYISIQQPDAILLFDHLDRLQPEELESILFDIEKVSLSCILISRDVCPSHLFKCRADKIIQWRAASLNEEEALQIASLWGNDGSLVPMILNATQGNALKVCQMLVKLTEKIPTKETLKKEYLKSLPAIAACGGFLDEQLFCKNYNLRSDSLKILEKLGFIRYTKEGCLPHDSLMEIVEENRWPLDMQAACSYWSLQIVHTPYNRWACRSLVLLASQMEDCTPFKGALSKCLETLNKREYLLFLLDLVKIFKKQGWQELLLKATDYLIEHEEYQLSHEILDDLMLSSSSRISQHATKNEVRRLMWTGDFDKSLKLNLSLLKKTRSPNLLIPLRNTLGISRYQLGEWDEALSLFQKNLNQKEIEPLELGIAKHMTGVIMIHRGQYNIKTKKILESAFLIFESSHYYHWMILALNATAHFSYGLRQWHQAFYFLRKSMEIAEIPQNQAFTLYTLACIGQVSIRIFDGHSHEVTSIMLELEETFKRPEKVGITWATPWGLIYLSIIYIHRGEIHKLKQAIDMLTPTSVLFKNINVFVKILCGHYATMTHDITKAKEYYQEAKNLAKIQKNFFALDEMHLDLKTLTSKGIFRQLPIGI